MTERHHTAAIAERRDEEGDEAMHCALTPGHSPGKETGRDWPLAWRRMLTSTARPTPGNDEQKTSDDDSDDSHPGNPQESLGNTSSRDLRARHAYQPTSHRRHCAAGPHAARWSTVAAQVRQMNECSVLTLALVHWAWPSSDVRKMVELLLMILKNAMPGIVHTRLYGDDAAFLEPLVF